MTDIEDQVNPTVEWKKRRKKVLSCSFCRPHRGENATYVSKNSKVKKPRKHRRQK